MTVQMTTPATRSRRLLWLASAAGAVALGFAAAVVAVTLTADDPPVAFPVPGQPTSLAVTPEAVWVWVADSGAQEVLRFAR